MRPLRDAYSGSATGRFPAASSSTSAQSYLIAGVRRDKDLGAGVAVLADEFPATRPRVIPVRFDLRASDPVHLHGEGVRRLSELLATKGLR